MCVWSRKSRERTKGLVQLIKGLVQNSIPALHHTSQLHHNVTMSTKRAGKLLSAASVIAQTRLLTVGKVGQQSSVPPHGALSTGLGMARDSRFKASAEVTGPFALVPISL
jgi:hypothetical protein